MSRLGERARRIGSEMTRIASDTKMVTPVQPKPGGLAISRQETAK
jgi:hypothetical protein